MLRRARQREHEAAACVDAASEFPTPYVPTNRNVSHDPAAAAAAAAGYGAVAGAAWGGGEEEGVRPRAGAPPRLRCVRATNPPCVLLFCGVGSTL